MQSGCLPCSTIGHDALRQDPITMTRLSGAAVSARSVGQRYSASLTGRMVAVGAPPALAIGWLAIRSPLSEVDGNSDVWRSALLTAACSASTAADWLGKRASNSDPMRIAPAQSARLEASRAVRAILRGRRRSRREHQEVFSLSPRLKSFYCCAHHILTG